MTVTAGHFIATSPIWSGGTRFLLHLTVSGSVDERIFLTNVMRSGIDFVWACIFYHHLLRCLSQHYCMSFSPV
jgi:hypothetical protein